MAENSTTIELEYPVTLEGQEVTSITLRRPKVRDLRKMEKARGSDTDRSLGLLVDLSERPSGLFDELDPADMAQINAWLAPILDPKPTDG